MQKISNTLLLDIVEISEQNKSFSLKECAEHGGYKSNTVSNWYYNFKKGKWAKDYNKTEDGIALSPETVDKFINCFEFSSNMFKILKKLVNKKCLRDKFCIGKQSKILKKIFKEYPNIDFWLHVDFGEPRDDILFFLGKNKQNLDKKYIDFTAKDSYTKFDYKYKPENKPPRKKKKKNLWDFY